MIPDLIAENTVSLQEWQFSQLCWLTTYRGTKKAASVLLGQNRREMMFWRLHTDAPNFLVVFRDAEQRNAFFHSPFLQEVQ